MSKWFNVGLRSRRTKVMLMPDGTDQPRIVPEPVFRGIEFVRQISVPSDCERSMWGGTMRLIGIDLYKDGLLLRWLFTPGRVDASDPAAAAALISKIRDSVLRDDVGTNFLASTYASGRSNGVLRAEVSFMPDVPAKASSLTISMEGHDFTVGLG
jgi:hypothetical protein